jgi:hypothetical protein
MGKLDKIPSRTMIGIVHPWKHPQHSQTAKCRRLALVANIAQTSHFHLLGICLVVATESAPRMAWQYHA